MVTTRLPTSKSSSPFSNPLVTVPNAPITIGIIVTCMFHSFFQFPSKVEVVILLFTFFQFYSVASRDSKVDNILFYSFESFSCQSFPMVSHWSLSDNKSPQVYRTLLSTLADLNSVIIWMVSTRPFNSKSSTLFNNPLVTIPRVPITIGIVVTFKFHSFFNSLARSRYLSYFLLSFNFTLWSAGQGKSTIL